MEKTYTYLWHLSAARLRCMIIGVLYQVAGRPSALTGSLATYECAIIFIWG